MHDRQNRTPVGCEPVGDFPVIAGLKKRKIGVFTGIKRSLAIRQPKAQAPLMVAAEIASAGDIFMWVQARDSTNGILGVGDEPRIVIRGQSERNRGINKLAGGWKDPEPKK